MTRCVCEDNVTIVHHYLADQLGEKNDAVFVGNVLRKELMPHIRRYYSAARHIHIWSDGGAAHFKQHQAMGHDAGDATREYDYNIIWNFFPANPWTQRVCDNAASYT
jgi:hypothetical protein